MSPRLNSTNQSKHDFHDFNDSNPKIDFTDSNSKIDNNPEADFNVSNDDDNEDCYADRDRILFMKSLVPVGNSFALVFHNSNSELTFLRYEGFSDDKVSEDSQRGIIRTLNGVSQNVSPGRNQGPSIIKMVSDDDRSIKEDNVARALRKKRKNDQDHSGHSRKVGSSSGRGLTKKGKNDQAKKRKNDGNGAKKKSSSIMKAQVNQGKSVEKTRSSGTILEAPDDHENGAEKTTISCKVETQDDQDYGDSNRSSSIRLRNYSEKKFDIEDGEIETCSGTEVEVLDKDPLFSEFVHTQVADSKVIDASMEDDDVLYIVECSKPENLQFRKDVEDILKRPYDKKEYDTLWLQVNSRKPMQGHKELRGGHDITYAKDAMGKAYLDVFHDLQKILDTFRADLPRKLNVLRGFFFYLKKIACEGIFKPWLDESCMAIVTTTEYDLRMKIKVV